jgi:hypothetical protein
MHDNVGARDCAVRIAIGLAFIFVTLILGDGSTRWLALLGLLPVGSAIFGYCPAYALFGLDTVRRPPSYP